MAAARLQAASTSCNAARASGTALTPLVSRQMSPASLACKRAVLPAPSGLGCLTRQSHAASTFTAAGLSSTTSTTRAAAMKNDNGSSEEPLPFDEQLKRRLEEERERHEDKQAAKDDNNAARLGKLLVEGAFVWLLVDLLGSWTPVLVPLVMSHLPQHIGVSVSTVRWWITNMPVVVWVMVPFVRLLRAHWKVHSVYCAMVEKLGQEAADEITREVNEELNRRSRNKPWGGSDRH